MKELLEVEFRPDSSEGPQLHFNIPSVEILAKFSALFRELAKRATAVELAECDFVNLKNITGVSLASVGEGEEPRVNLWFDKNKTAFRWVHDAEGWVRCAELVEPLKPGTHQYFDYDKPGEIEARASFPKLRS
jgi:hypothetical protein